MPLKLLLAQCVVVLDSLNFVLKLLDPAQDVHVLLLQDTQPQLIPQHCDSAQLPNQHLDLHTRFTQDKTRVNGNSVKGIWGKVGVGSIPAGPWWG